MKKIINDKMYDTDKATLIYSNDSLPVTRNYYRTDQGAFFCCYLPSGKIQLISEQTMKDILADKDPDAYINIFGDVAYG